MTAFYNEIDPAACAILAQLMAEGVIAPGVIDSRSIADVQPEDLDGFTQVHLFAGGGLWSVAARLAGWPDDKPIWTASFPCQPFSAAGRGLGVDDPRHLWPHGLRLIRARRPPVIVGEQVAGAAGYGWFDGVRVDLAGENYASRSVDFPTCAVDAPHQRQRQYWIGLDLADAADRARAGRPREIGGGDGRDAADRGADGMANADGIGREVAGDAARLGAAHGARISEVGHHSGPDGDERGAGDVGDAELARLEGWPGHGDRGAGRAEPARPVAAADGGGFGMGDADGGERAGQRLPARRADGEGVPHAARADGPVARTGRNGTYWSGAEWIICHDGKARRSEPSIRMLVDGLPGRVDLWRVAGNGISPWAAAEVLAALLDVGCRP